MKIQQKDYYHGAALTQIVEHESFKALNKADAKYGHYKINHDIRLMVKIATSDNDTWQFTANSNDLTIIREGINADDKFFMCLVCGLNTVCLLDSDQVQQLIDVTSDDQQWLKVTAKDGGSLWAKSRIAELSRAIPHNAFPEKLFSVQL